MDACVRLVPWALAAALLVAPVAGATNYDESTNGDISGNRLAPTSLSLTPGNNTVTGSVMQGEIDYLTLIVPVGFTLAQINLVSFSSTDDLGFIGVQAGSTFTQPPTGTDVTKLLGWSHFGIPASGPYFDMIGTGPGAIGFNAPLPAGPYTFWIQQANLPLINYSWNFVVAGGVPEPGTGSLAGLGLAALLGRVANRLFGRSQ